MTLSRGLLLLSLLGGAGTGAAMPPPEFDAGPGAPGDAPVTETRTPATAPPPPYAARLREDGRRVLAGPDFHQRETARYPVARDWLRRWLNDRDPKPVTPPRFNLALLADAFKFLALALLVLGLGWLLWRGWQWLAPRPPARHLSSRPLLHEATSLALANVPLPDSISGAARNAWQAGDAARALSLLYRGAVHELATRHHIALPDSATETECLRQARQSGAAVVGAGFVPIVQAWMAQAYAQRPPADFEALLVLYRHHFEAPPGDAP